MLNYKYFVEKGCFLSYKYGSVSVPHCNFFFKIQTLKMDFPTLILEFWILKLIWLTLKLEFPILILEFSTLKLIFPTLMLEFLYLILELATFIFCCYYDKLLHFRRTPLKRDLYHARLMKKRSKYTNSKA